MNPLGASFVRLISAGTAVSTLILPATNVRGLIIRSVSAKIDATNTAALFIDTAAPASAADVGKRMVWLVGAQNFSNLQLPIDVPPALGLYLAVTAGATTNFGLVYDLL